MIGQPTTEILNDDEDKANIDTNKKTHRWKKIPLRTTKKTTFFKNTTKDAETNNNEENSDKQKRQVDINVKTERCRK